jgi:chitin synthase
MMQNQPGRLIYIMDDQVWHAPKTDQLMVEAFSKRWGSHSFFKTSGIDLCTSKNFLKHNQDAVNPDFVLLASSVSMHNATGSDPLDSSNPFIKGLSLSKAIVMQAHPSNKETIVSHQQSVKLMCIPSMCQRTQSSTAQQATWLQTSMSTRATTREYLL